MRRVTANSRKETSLSRKVSMLMKGASAADWLMIGSFAKLRSKLYQYDDAEKAAYL